MNHDRTYRPVRHVPAPRLRDADGSMRQVPLRFVGYVEIPTCDPRRFPCGDPDGFDTEYGYDKFGRLTHRHHPDAGDDWYEYDPAGNLTRHTNAAGEHLDYTYHYNQLTSIACSQYPENNVHYEYGTSADASINAVGKVILQEDASGWQTFSYGKLGELTENIRTFAPPFENQAYTFNMYFEYDSWNRIQIITYPDGEKVSYDYNRGGMLESVIGDKNGDTYKYIEEIRYNPFEQKETVYYGNGTVTDYSYDVLLRLSHLRSVCADGTMQDIDYDYDEVSNINSIENLAGVLPNNLGGTYRSDYSYDNLYRLISANGEWQGNNTLYYETSMEYEKNGRISRKVLHADTWLNGVYAMDNYNNEYHYTNTAQPNTLTFINNSTYQNFAWDVKGNMIYHMNYGVPMKRYLCWDEQNRLLGVKDDKQRLSYYLYDANGDRTYKFTGEYAAQNQSGQWHYYYLLNCPTLYASPYLVTNKKGYTKHYYAESERIASRIGGGGLQDLHKGFENYPDMVGKHKESSAKLFYKVMKCLDADALPQKDALKYLYDWQEVVEDEKDCYWYHPDHLGSSSWITDTGGHAIQHLYYLPWGEDFVDQKSSGFDGVRFTFSAKEKDSETGLSYFGSRYYSSDLSIWLSVDPMSDKYAYQSGYVYCGNNPLKVIDPNGEDEWEIDKKGNVNWVRKSETHRLYALDENRKRTGDFITVKDKSSLEQLTIGRKDYDGHYSVCNKEDAFNIFKFGADHCDVEWAVAGYNTKGGGREYVVGTSNMNPQSGYSGAVSDFHNSESFDKFNLSFYIHSHSGPDATQGASKGYDGTDMGNIIRLYYSYRNSGRSTIPGKGFPRHYVYTPNTRTLYYYSVYKSSVFIRGNIRSANDLYRNLAF